MLLLSLHFFFFFFNDTATTEIYTLSLHDALPISRRRGSCRGRDDGWCAIRLRNRQTPGSARRSNRSEEHTSELQSRSDLVCRLLLEKKKTTQLSSSPVQPDLIHARDTYVTDAHVV